MTEVQAISLTERTSLKEFSGAFNGLTPLDHLMIGSSIRDPNDPSKIIGKTEILERGPQFFLKFLPGATTDELAERQVSTYRDGMPTVLDPMQAMALEENYDFRIVLPKMEPGNHTTEPFYEIQLRRIGGVGSDHLTAAPDLSSINISKKFEKYFVMTVLPNYVIPSFRISVRPEILNQAV